MFTTEISLLSLVRIPLPRKKVFSQHITKFKKIKLPSSIDSIIPNLFLKI